MSSCSISVRELSFGLKFFRNVYGRCLLKGRESVLSLRSPTLCYGPPHHRNFSTSDVHPRQQSLNSVNRTPSHCAFQNLCTTRQYSSK